MNKKLFNFLSMMLMYALGLFTGSQWGVYWIIPFLCTGIIGMALIIAFEMFRSNK